MLSLSLSPHATILLQLRQDPDAVPAAALCRRVAPVQGVGGAPPVDVALHRGVLRAGRPRGRDGARVLAALRQEQHHGATVANR